MPHLNGVAREPSHRFAEVQRVMGLLLMTFSLTMLPPVVVSLLYGEGGLVPFLTGLLINFATGALVWWPVRNSHGELKTRDGFLITVLFWSVLGVFGSIPLYLADWGWRTWTDAVFEAVSGLTTTGATVVPHGLDQLPHAINFYRCQLHWLGGVGVIVLAVAVLPILGVGGMQLFKAETPGPMKDAKLTPRITGTARAVWLVYAVLTAACALTYWALGMTFFDAICHAMSTMATGGFSTHDASIGWFNSPGIEAACMVFMVLGASNFSLHYLAWQRRSPQVYFADTEFRAFIFMFVALAALVCTPLYLDGVYPDLAAAVRKGLFQAVAYGASAGFRTADVTPWPTYVPLLLVFATFFGSCAGGTGGGVKLVRVVLFLKQLGREMRRPIHPSAEMPVKLDKKSVPDSIVNAIGTFFAVYLGLSIVLTLLMIATGLDAVTAYSAVAGAINNSGPGLGALHATLATVTLPGKWVLIFAMLLGRFEVFGLLIVFMPEFWRR